MLRRTIAAIAVIVGGLAIVPAASAHNVDKAFIECTASGGTETVVFYSSFTPVNGQREAITVTYTNGTVATGIPPTDNGSFTIPGPTVPNGTSLGASGKWAEGTFTIPAKTFNCQPPPPTPPTCTPPSTLVNGQCVPPATPPVTPPAPPVTPPAPPAPPAPPVTPPHHHHHVIKVSLAIRFVNHDPPAVEASDAAAHGCRIVGPRSWMHGLVHWQVRCNAKMIGVWHWKIAGQPVHSHHWTYTRDHGHTLFAWLFDREEFTLPNIAGVYTISVSGHIRR